jgi:Fe-S-cluster-containing hydrogenase component 2
VVCPTAAYSQRKGGGVIVKKKLCIRCGECAKACPVGAIYLAPSGEPFVCIHCGRCVPYCPHDCLELSAFSRGKADTGNETATAGEVEE